MLFLLGRNPHAFPVTVMPGLVCDSSPPNESEEPGRIGKGPVSEDSPAAFCRGKSIGATASIFWLVVCRLPVPPEVTSCEALSLPIGMERSRVDPVIDMFVPLLFCIVRPLFTASELGRDDASFMLNDGLLFQEVINV
jgi:hypothetical protein